MSLFSKLFKEHGAKNVITLFHAPSSKPSIRILTLLKQRHGEVSSSATEDQASSHSEHTSKAGQASFDLDVTEEPPTQDQLKSILEYVGAGNVGGIVEGARSESEALRKLKERPETFQRPLVVDWNMGKAVVGDKESEILSLLKQTQNDS